MALYLDLLKRVPAIEQLEQIARHQDLSLYVVGGFVRDFLMKRRSKDLDILCVGSGVGIAQQLGKQLGCKVTVYKNYGTAMLHHQGWQIEFVGARKESYSSESRNPKVSPGSLEDDLRRRDFTLNALAVGITGEQRGQLIDLFGGKEDLERRILRTPVAAEKTFYDDPLRMWRAVRFAVQLEAQIEQKSAQAIARLAARSGKILSYERILTEFNKILLSSDPTKGLLLLDRFGLLVQLLPELIALKGRSFRKGFSHKDNFIHTLQVVQNIAKSSSNLYLRWAGLLHDIAKPLTKRFDPKVGFTFHGHEDLGARMVPKIFKRLRLPMGAKMKYVAKLVQLHLRPIALVQEVTDSALRRLTHDAGDDFADLMLLCRADVTSKNQRRMAHYLRNFDLVERKIAEIEAKDHIRNLQPVLDGGKIMDIFDLPPGPQVGYFKKALKDAILDGKLPNEEQALYTYLLQLAAAKGLKPVRSL